MIGRALGLAGIVVAAGAAAAAAQNVEQLLRSNQQRLEEIRRERDQLESELQRVRSRVHNISSELSNLERQKGVTGRIVNELDRQIGSMRGQLDTLSVELVLTQDALAEKRAVLERRLSEIYKRGPLWTYQAMLAAESFGNLLSRYKYLYLVSRQDRALVGEVEELRDRIARRRQELLNVRAELARRRDERGLELSRYLRLERDRELNLRRTRASEREAAARLESLTKDEQRLNDIISALERARRAALAAAAPAEGTIRTADLGSLDWPVDGRILYQFGRVRLPNNTYIRYNGVGIGVPIGTPVKAIEAGTVRTAGSLGTYGPTVFLDHGGGFYTLYLYLSRVQVKAGQPVAKGQVIGLSGGANSEEGPHIEFQIRGEGGIALDPVNWLKSQR
ncbi:MAG: peptidoglycan DD-metalloendopeptidase family protein [Gemmatimonadetes bacterium]|nr:peptidoglycan DD-metalloendopeptidase family protein [Gemmatimonadota bacterium]